MLSNFRAPEFDSAFSDRSLRGRWIDGVLGVLRRALPQACVLCTASAGDALLCAACRYGMPRLGPACRRCALPASTGATCARCRAAPPPYASTIAAWSYAFPADRLLHAFKYRSQLALAVPLGEALAEAVARADGALPDLIVAVPLSRGRQRQRGFNQSQQLARVVARATGVPLGAVLRRTRDSPPQAALSRAARSTSIRGAFECTVPLDGRVIAIVDDVMTTGATVSAAAQALRDAGARRVDAWVVARTLLS